MRGYMVKNWAKKPHIPPQFWWEASIYPAKFRHEPLAHNRRPGSLQHTRFTRAFSPSYQARVSRRRGHQTLRLLSRK